MTTEKHTTTVHDLRNIAEGLGQAQDMIDGVARADSDLRDTFNFGITDGFSVATVSIETDEEIGSIIRGTFDSMFDGSTDLTANEVRLLGALAGSLALLRGLQGDEVSHE